MSGSFAPGLDLNDWDWLCVSAQVLGKHLHTHAFRAAPPGVLLRKCAVAES